MELNCIIYIIIITFLRHNTTGYFIESERERLNYKLDLNNCIQSRISFFGIFVGLQIIYAGILLNYEDARLN